MSGIEVESGDEDEASDERAHGSWVVDFPMLLSALTT